MKQRSEGGALCSERRKSNPNDTLTVPSPDAILPGRQHEV